MMNSAPRFRRAASVAIAAAITIVGLGACGSDSGISPKTGSLQVQLTDAPFPFDSVARVDLFVVRIDGKAEETDSVEIQEHLEDKDRDRPEFKWTTLASPNQSFNLLDLQSGKTTNLGQLTIATGTYRGFRLILDVDKSSVTLKDGTVLTSTSTPGIKFPSAGRRGIKILLDKPVTLTEGGSVMVIDFDLGRSFVMRGHTVGQQGLLFKPVIRATARDITGAIAGTVHRDSTTGPVLADATVEILKAGTAVDDTVSANIIASTKTDATGAYKAAFLLPATYAVRATGPAASGVKAGLVAGVAVTTGQTTTGTDFVLKP